MATANMLLQCGFGLDEDGEFFTILTTNGEQRLFYIEDGEQISDGSAQYLPVQGFGEQANGTIAIKLKTMDKRARTNIYRVPRDQVILESELDTSCGCVS